MHTETVELGGREVTFETGGVARQASGSVVVTVGDTTLLAVVTAESKPTRLHYMPLTVEYRNRYAAAGRIPGSYDRRETRATEFETLTARVIDRSIRPLFPETWCYDTQVIVQPFSYDPATDPEVLAVSAAAAALTVSPIPWTGPVAGVRVVRSGGELVAWPTAEQRAAADLDLVITANREGIAMVEGGAAEVDEATILEAFALARRAAAPLLDLLDRLAQAAGSDAEREAPAATDDPDLRGRVREAALERLDAALAVPGKHDRYAALDALKDAVVAELELDEGAADLARRFVEDLKKERIRAGILAGRRLGGRGPEEVRPISGRAGWLKRCHGSALFTRGETQAIVSCTLGRDRDAQSIETLDGQHRARFLLHYNFPPYCVGEVKPLRGPARREVGHGHLARRGLLAMVPPQAEVPFTIRLESTITESNGSSSMATVCGGSLALMDAGLPIERPVAGIAMGLVAEGDRFQVISDILGDEDHVGDMDFKVAGTERGVTAIQLDNKVGSLPDAVMAQALEQARAGRLHILGEMARIRGEPRPEPSAHTPKVSSVRIERNRIGDLIGPGGKHIRGIREETGAEIDVDDTGFVRVFANAGASLDEALARIEELTGAPRVGEEYEARVVSVKHFGCFVRLFQGVEALIPGAELREGTPVRVRVDGVNPEGKLVISRVGARGA